MSDDDMYDEDGFGYEHYQYDEDDMNDDDDNNNMNHDHDEDDDDEEEEEDAIDIIRKNNPSLTSCHVDVFNIKDASRLAEALQVNTHLKKLRLVCGPCVNEYGPYLVPAIENMATLTHLWLGSSLSYFANDAFPYNPSLFIAAARRSPTIQHLEVCVVDGEGMEEISDCMSHIQTLQLRGDYVVSDIRLLCDGLQRTTTLTSLYLCDEMFMLAHEFRRLSQALANNTSLISLHLANNEMDNNGVKFFLEHWHHDSQIRNLAITNTKITAEGAMLLLQAASSHPAMESLNIKENSGIGYEGLANIALELPNVVLKSLNMALCAVPRYGRIDPKWSGTAVVVANLIAQGVKDNTHLVKIDISGKGFEDAAEQGAIKALAHYTLRNKFTPLVSDSQLPVSVWCICFAKHSQNASFIFHFLREQPMLWANVTRVP